ncbi:MAG TPA: ATP-binding protein [Candidatus Angelobacter sp.]|nr:ATP-binding protein [Candidatus Angelobacter sp.]
MMNQPQCEWRSGPPWRSGQDWRSSGHAGRIRFFRRIAAAAFVLFLLGVCGMIALAWLAAKALGIFSHSSQGVSFAIVVVGFLAALLTVIFLVVTFRQIGLPLRMVMEAADRVAEGDYSVRVKEYGPAPIRRLARSFNTMTERLGKHDQQRRNLMADVAHELRTPLTIIQGKLEGLLDGVYLRDDVQIAGILDEAHLLSRLVEDLRTLALSEAGTLKLEKELTDVSDLVCDAASAFTVEASERGITLKTVVPADLPHVTIDAVRIRQVLNNLLSNALRYTPAGGSVETSAGTMDRGTVWIQVRDTGRGMTQEEIESAFERFQKGPGSQGSGLGLTIARNLVVAHGGEIQAGSQPDLGTTIRFTLPNEDKET